MSNNAKYSKFLSFVLRHRPAEIGLELDDHGWAEVDTLLEAAAGRDERWTLELLREVVATNSKQRFEFSPDGLRIRARQGHSVDVDLGYEPTAPPDVLYHGTVGKFVASIQSEGLRPSGRHHVHLSEDIATASQVGARRGKPVILRIDAERMAADGHEFMCTDNRVWLCEAVPPQYLTVVS